MSIVEQLTPVYFRLVRLGIERRGGEVVAVADLRILNADGRAVGGDTPAAVLTEAERSAVEAFVARNLANYAALTGLTEWPGGGVEP